jgi:hypothetical protein
MDQTSWVVRIFFRMLTLSSGGLSVWDLSMDFNREMVASLAGTWWTTVPK